MSWERTAWQNRWRGIAELHAKSHPRDKVRVQIVQFQTVHLGIFVRRGPVLLNWFAFFEDRICLEMFTRNRWWGWKGILIDPLRDEVLSEWPRSSSSWDPDLPAFTVPGGLSDAQLAAILGEVMDWAEIHAAGRPR